MNPGRPGVFLRSLGFLLLILAPAAFGATQGTPGEALPPPTDLEILEISPKKITIGWTPSPHPDVAGYIIYRREGNERFREVATLNGWRKRLFTDKGKTFRRLKHNREYTYAMASFASDGRKSRKSAEVTAQTLGKPQPVQELRATGGPRKIEIRWGARPELEVTGYRIYRLEPGKKDLRLIKTVRGRTTTRFEDTALRDLTQYSYRITSLNEAGLESSLSEAASAKTFAPPLTPIGLEVAPAKKPSQGIKLQWQENPERRISNYIIFRSTHPKKGYRKIGQAGSRSAKYHDLDTRPATLYYYSLVAVDLDGLESAPSIPVRAFTQTPPLPPRQLTAKGTSGTLVLEWKASDDPDVRGYVVYQKHGLKWTSIGRTAIPRFNFQKAEPGSTYKFQVAAYAVDGLESSRSKTLKVVLEPVSNPETEDETEDELW